MTWWFEAALGIGLLWYGISGKNAKWLFVIAGSAIALDIASRANSGVGLTGV